MDLDSKTIGNQAEKLVKEYNVKVKGFVCDVSDSLSVKDCVNRVVKELAILTFYIIMQQEKSVELSLCFF